LEAGFAGRYIAGDVEGFGQVMSPSRFAARQPVSLFFPAAMERLLLTVNYARFFIDAPYFLDKGILELKGLAFFVGGGVRGDVYSIFNNG
jgi:hypothetical protein